MSVCLQAKTVVAPLDRVKILFQASNPDFHKYAGEFCPRDYSCWNCVQTRILEARGVVHLGLGGRYTERTASLVSSRDILRLSCVSSRTRPSSSWRMTR